MSQASVAPAVLEFRERLKERYLRFFRDMGVDLKTGDYPACRPADRKFAGYPYIGSMYGRKRHLKLLVVGLDIGADGLLPGSFESFEQRRRAIERKPVEQHNPHIAGTYFTALKYTGPKYEWETFEDDPRTCQRILKEEAPQGAPGLPPTNPLSRIALTNFYKWVTKGKKTLSGADNRIHFNRELEIKLFQDEVHILKPDVVVFQSTMFESAFKEILGPGAVASSYVLKHPSIRGNRQPKEIVRPVAQHPPP